MSKKRPLPRRLAWFLLGAAAPIYILFALVSGRLAGFEGGRFRAVGESAQWEKLAISQPHVYRQYLEYMARQRGHESTSQLASFFDDQMLRWSEQDDDDEDMQGPAEQQLVQLEDWKPITDEVFDDGHGGKVTFRVNPNIPIDISMVSEPPPPTDDWRDDLEIAPASQKAVLPPGATAAAAPGNLNMQRRLPANIRAEFDYGFMRYFPHSQFNNQRLSLEHALTIAALLNRTLILPRCYLGNFRNGWRPFNPNANSGIIHALDHVYGLRDNWDIQPAVAVPCHVIFDLEQVPAKWITIDALRQYRQLNPGLLRDEDAHFIADTTRYDYR